MNKDNEIYVTSNGELYKKGVEQAIYPQTNYTTQQFYTKEEYEKLQAENERLKQEKQELNIEIVSLTSKLFTLEKSSNDLSQGINKLYQALQEIKGIAEDRTKTEDYLLGQEYTDLVDKIIAKINEVMGVE